MKLSELKPCALCHGPLLKPPMGCWYVIRISHAMVNPRAARQVVGLDLMFGGALGIAEAMAPDADGAVTIVGDKEPSLMTELHVCFECYSGKLQDLAIAAEAPEVTK